MTTTDLSTGHDKFVVVACANISNDILKMELKWKNDFIDVELW